MRRHYSQRFLKNCLRFTARVDNLPVDTLDVAVGGRTINPGIPGNKEKLAFLLIQDGPDLYDKVPDDLSFVILERTVQRISIAAVACFCVAATLGNLTVVPNLSLLATFNPGETDQVLSGVAPGGRELQIGFEDLATATTTSKMS